MWQNLVFRTIVMHLKIHFNNHWGPFLACNKFPTLVYRREGVWYVGLFSRGGGLEVKRKVGMLTRCVLNNGPTINLISTINIG